MVWRVAWRTAGQGAKRGRVAGRYLWWRMVHALLPFGPPELLALEHRFHRRLLGRKQRPTRRSACASETKTELQDAAAFALNAQRPVGDVVEAVERVLRDVRAAFEALVAEARWMDAATRRATVEKLRAIDSFIGFPQWATDGARLDARLADLPALGAEAYLRNVVALRERSVRRLLEALGARNPSDADTWETIDPIQVNAFYTRLSNSIVIPAGILQTPFFRRGHEGLNYGAIGAILGHELTHGFDSEGRKWDKNGRQRDWWSPSSSDEYSRRAECFVQQYSRFRLPGRHRVDGEQTLAENIADNGGVREALRALRLRGAAAPAPPPGLGAFTQEQIFFLGFANLWCHTSTPAYDAAILRDTHSPARFRVLGALQNAPSFAEVWGCPPGAPMRSQRRCIVW